MTRPVASRWRIRRCYAILGLIGDNGDASASTIAATLKYHFADVVFELRFLERQGRVISNLEERADCAPPQRIYRLPTKQDRR